MARKQPTPEQSFFGYLPGTPGGDDPFEEAPPRGRPTIVPSDGLDEEAPFEDELASPHVLPREPLPPEPIAAEAAPAPGPDPRALARRLAEEARAKARTSDPPKPSGRTSRNSQVSLPPPEPEEEPAPEPVAAPKKNRLAERAGGRPLSAEEALKRAVEREAAEAKAKKKADKVAARAAASAVLAESDDEDAAPEPEPKRRRRGDSLPPTSTAPLREALAAPARESRPPTAPDQEPMAAIDVATAIGRLAPGAEVLEVVPLTNPLVFRALWTAHRARAWATKDLALLATSAVLLDAVDRVPHGHLVAVRIAIAGRSVAAWVDTSRGAVLGLTEPPEVYLAGL